MTAFPSSPKPAGVEISSLQPTLISRDAALSRDARSQDRQRWLLRARFPAMTRAQWAPLYGFLVGRRGRFGVFDFTPPGIARLGSGAGSPVVRNRQNRFTYSAQVDHADWTKEVCAVTANYAVGPGGGVTAERAEFPTGVLSRYWQAASGCAGEDVTFSLWMKSNTGSSQSIRIHLREIGFGTAYASVYKTVTTSWQRFSITASIPSDSSAVMGLVYHSDTGDPVWDILVDQHQFEISYSAPGHYIETTTGAEAGEDQSGNRLLYTTGWTASQTDVLKAGDFIRPTGHGKVYLVTADADSDAEGKSEVTIDPAVVEHITDGVVLITDDVPFQVALADDLVESVFDYDEHFDLETFMIEAIA